MLFETALFWFKLLLDEFTVFDKDSKGTVLVLELDDGEEDDDDEDDEPEFWFMLFDNEIVEELDEPILLEPGKLLFDEDEDEDEEAIEVELTAAVNNGAADNNVIGLFEFWLLFEDDDDEGATVTTFCVEPPWKTVVIINWLPAWTILVGKELFPWWLLFPFVALLLLDPCLDEIVVSMLLFEFWGWLVVNGPSEVRVVILLLILLILLLFEDDVNKLGILIDCWFVNIWFWCPKLLLTSFVQLEESSILHDIFCLITN